MALAKKYIFFFDWYVTLVLFKKGFHLYSIVSHREFKRPSNLALVKNHLHPQIYLLQQYHPTTTMLIVALAVVVSHLPLLFSNCLAMILNLLVELVALQGA